MRKRTFYCLLVCFWSAAWPPRGKAQSWEVVTSGTNSSLRGVSVALDLEGSATIWASGSNGVVLVSADGGKRWQRRAVPGGESLDFRGVAGFGGSTAYLISSGEGAKSRIYKTTDGGASWKLQYSSERKESFLDAIGCWSETECYALGDPMDGKFVLLETKDGEHWERLAADGLEALPGEGAFAASNSCLSVDRHTGIYFVTGGPRARMFHSADRGKTWRVTEVPVAKGNASSGAFSLAVEGQTIVVAGGDYRDPQKGADSVAYSTDGGLSWNRPEVRPNGFRSAVASVKGPRFLTVGVGGSESSDDNGAHWKHAGSLPLNAVAVRALAGIWAVGANGTVAKFHYPE
jgi:photosystem II stability/assembly factor-like uncharacterized protein